MGQFKEGHRTRSQHDREQKLGLQTACLKVFLLRYFCIPVLFVTLFMLDRQPIENVSGFSASTLLSSWAKSFLLL